MAESNNVPPQFKLMLQVSESPIILDQIRNSKTWNRVKIIPFGKKRKK